MMSALHKPMSQASIRRLPGYLRFLQDLHRAGRQVVSCTRIAEAFRLSAIQVRKDLAATGIVGRPKTGYEVDVLIDHLKTYLGWNNTRDAVLAGAGLLGRALLGYDGFERHGVHIVCAFDTDPQLIGTAWQGKEIQPADKLTELVRRMRIRIGIITTPPRAAQAVADAMVAGGIRAIWNFAPVQLRVPDEVLVEPVELSAGLAVLSHRLEHGQDEG